MAALHDADALLIYQVGPVRCCAPTGPIEQIVLPPDLTHPPGSDAARPGIFKHGQHIVSVIDLRQRFGIEPARWQPGRLVITQLARGYTGFWVDQIVDVIRSPTEGWGGLPPHLPRDAFSRTLLYRDKIHLYTDFEQLHKLHPAGFLRQYLAHLEQQAPSDESTSRSEPSPRKPADNAHPVDRGTETPPGTTTPTPAPPAPAPAPRQSVETISPGPSSSPATTTHTAPRSTRAVKPETPAPERPRHAPDPVSGPTRPAAESMSSTSTRHVSPASPGLAAEDPAPAPVTPTPPPDPPRMKPAATSPPDRQPDRPAAPATPAREGTQAESSRLPAIVSGLLLLAGLGVGAYLYLLPEPPMPLIQAPRSAPVAREPAAVVSPPYAVSPAPPVATPQPAPTPQQLPAESPAPDSAPDPAQTGETPGANPLTGLTSTGAPYRATIEQDATGITLIFEEPAPIIPAVSAGPANPLADDNTPPIATQTPANDAAADPVDEQTDQPEQAEPATAPPHRQEILHVVRRGDTLWDIASRYVDNPWRYPELAENSDIRNPDLIYPGDEVRIIIYRGRRP